MRGRVTHEHTFADRQPPAQGPALSQRARQFISRDDVPAGAAAAGTQSPQALCLPTVAEAVLLGGNASPRPRATRQPQASGGKNQARRRLHESVGKTMRSIPACFV